MSRRTRSMPVAAVALALVAWPVLGVAGAASAHSFPVDQNPAADSTLTTLPETFSLTVNEPLLVVGDSLAGFALEVQDSAGRFYGGCPAVAGATMSIPAALGEAGTYRVTWQVVSADGHTVSDSYRFTWAPAAGQTVSAGTASAPACGSSSAATGDSPAPDVAADAQLGDVLWVGGVLAAVAIAVAITLVLVGRRRGADDSPDAAPGT